MKERKWNIKGNKIRIEIDSGRKMFFVCEGKTRGNVTNEPPPPTTSLSSIHSNHLSFLCSRLEHRNRCTIFDLHFLWIALPGVPRPLSLERSFMLRCHWAIVLIEEQWIGLQSRDCQCGRWRSSWTLVTLQIVAVFVNLWEFPSSMHDAMRNNIDFLFGRLQRIALGLRLTVFKMFLDFNTIYFTTAPRSGDYQWRMTIF